jgi:hypothetical protein
LYCDSSPKTSEKSWTRSSMPFLERSVAADPHSHWSYTVASDGKGRKNASAEKTFADQPPFTIPRLLYI